MHVEFRSQRVGDVKVFCRSAGLDAEVILLDAGHFAAETHAAEIDDAMRRFLGRHLDGRAQ